MLSPAERRTGWMLAEQAELERPYRIQSLLGRSAWRADVLRECVRDYLFQALGDAAGLLVIDETGCLKKGQHSVGVARQYSGTAGRVENCQVGMFAAYASRWGHALIDRQFYLPKEWAENEARRDGASIPTEVAFATKPALAREMDARGSTAGLPCALGAGGRDLRARTSSSAFAGGARPTLCARRAIQPGGALSGWVDACPDGSCLDGAAMLTRTGTA
jgi:SRSO17 transposase